jgi:hypothetical protein
MPSSPVDLPLLDRQNLGTSRPCRGGCTCERRKISRINWLFFSPCRITDGRATYSNLNLYDNLGPGLTTTILNRSNQGCLKPKSITHARNPCEPWNLSLENYAYILGTSCGGVRHRPDIRKKRTATTARQTCSGQESSLMYVRKIYFSSFLFFSTRRCHTAWCLADSSTTSINHIRGTPVRGNGASRIPDDIGAS